MYHDGYLSTGGKALEDLINKSDIVLCSTDVNSHNACLSVKKICKKLSKDCRILPSSSISSISRVLVDLNDA